MANPILIKRSAVADKVPAITDIALGELAINTADGKLFLKKSVAGTESIVQVGPLTTTELAEGTNLYFTPARAQAAVTSVSTATTATNIAAGATGSLPYQSAAGTTAMLAAGATGTVLTIAGGVPTWAAAAAGGGGGGLTNTAVKTSAYTAVANDLVRVDSTNGAFTVTLPAAPTDGDKIGLLDVSYKCGLNAVLIAANGKTVELDATGLSANTIGASFTLIYNSYNTNWKLI